MQLHFLYKFDGTHVSCICQRGFSNGLCVVNLFCTGTGMGKKLNYLTLAVQPK